MLKIFERGQPKVRNATSHRSFLQFLLANLSSYLPREIDTEGEQIIATPIEAN
jgi:hypothetical protein